MENLRGKLGDVSGAAADAVSSQAALGQVVQGLTGNTQDAADAQSGLADATADAAEDAKTAGQAWDEYRQALDSIIDSAFAFTDAEANMYSALDNLNQSLYDNGNVFNTWSEGGRENTKALEDYLKSVAQYASQTAESIGLSGQQAQDFIAKYVLSAIDDLKAQGVDTTWVDKYMNDVVNSIGQTKIGRAHV